MRIPFMNKMRSEPATKQDDSRAGLLARIAYHEGVESAIDLKVRAGLAPPYMRDRNRDDVAAARQALAQWEAAHTHAAAIASAQAERGPALLAQAQTADVVIQAAVTQLKAALDHAKPIADAIEREFADLRKPGFVCLVAPFAGTRLLERLTFWMDSGRGVCREPLNVFADRVKAYDDLLQPPKPPAPPRQISYNGGIPTTRPMSLAAKRNALKKGIVVMNEKTEASQFVVTNEETKKKPHETFTPELQASQI
jgi:hypothetical protein